MKLQQADHVYYSICQTHTHTHKHTHTQSRPDLSSGVFTAGGKRLYLATWTLFSRVSVSNGLMGTIFLKQAQSGAKALQPGAAMQASTNHRL